jgi:hypothetical protein
MVISSRTPEGDPNRCPVCGRDCRLEPSLFGRDAPCANCGHLLWFTKSRSAELQKLVKRILEDRFGLQSKEVEAAVKALVERADPEQLMERVLTATSLADLLADKV